MTTPGPPAPAPALVAAPPAPSVGPWVPVSPCTPRCLPPPGDLTRRARAGRALRAAFRATVLALVIGLGAVAALPAPLLGPAALGAVQRRWALAVLSAAGVRLRVRTPAGHAEPSAGVLVVANHVSWLDVLALYALAPVRLLAKSEVRAWPLLGAMAARAGTVFLDRRRLRSLPAAVTELAAAMRAGGTVGVFPEGTTRCGRELGDFRPAAFQAAIDAGAPTVPVAVHYDDGAAAFVGDDTLVSSLSRVLPAPHVVLTLDVLAPQEPVVLPAGAPRAAATARRRELARRCEGAIADSLARTAVPVAPVAVAETPARGEVLGRVA